LNLILALAAIPPALCIGSFLATVAYRLPLGLGLAAPRSACPRCGVTLGFLDLIPVASWVLRRGRCRHCGGAIDGLYAMVEGAAAIVAIVSIAAFTGWAVAASCLLGWTLVTLAAIDLRHRILPDILTLPLVAAGLGLGWIDGVAAGTERTVGAIAGYALFAAITYFYRRFRGREGLGLGDAKLFAAAGAWLGWQVLPGVIFVAAVSALIGTLIVHALRREAVDRYSALSFGPYLALAIWLHWIARPHDIFALAGSYF